MLLAQTKAHPHLEGTVFEAHARTACSPNPVEDRPYDPWPHDGTTIPVDEMWGTDMMTNAYQTGKLSRRLRGSHRP